MSDPKSSYGEPVEEPGDVDDVVGRANEGLAEAEAARRDAVAGASAPEQTDASADAASSSAPVAAEPVSEPASDESAAERAGSAPEAGSAAAAPAEPDPWDTPEAASLDYRSSAADTAVYTPADDSPTVVAAPVVTPSEPVADAAYSPARTSRPPRSRSSCRRPRRPGRAATVPQPEPSDCSPRCRSRSCTSPCGSASARSAAT